MVKLLRCMLVTNSQARLHVGPAKRNCKAANLANSVRKRVRYNYDIITVPTFNTGVYMQSPPLRKCSGAIAAP